MKTSTLTALVATVVASAGSAATADASKLDLAMQPVMAEYLKIHKALAADTDKGVVPAAKQIAKLAAKLDPGMASGPHAAHYKDLPKDLEAAADKLARSKGIDKMRDAFKGLSRPMAVWATMSKPKGVKVLSCSVAKASWLQREKEVRNPYYGSKMLGCGDVVGGMEKGKAGPTAGHAQ